MRISGRLDDVRGSHFLSYVLTPAFFLFGYLFRRFFVVCGGDMAILKTLAFSHAYLTDFFYFFPHFAMVRGGKNRHPEYWRMAWRPVKKITKPFFLFFLGSVNISLFFLRFAIPFIFEKIHIILSPVLYIFHGVPIKMDKIKKISLILFLFLFFCILWWGCGFLSTAVFCCSCLFLCLDLQGLRWWDSSRW